MIINDFVELMPSCGWDFIETFAHYMSNGLINDIPEQRGKRKAKLKEATANSENNGGCSLAESTGSETHAESVDNNNTEDNHVEIEVNTYLFDKHRGLVKWNLISSMSWTLQYSHKTKQEKHSHWKTSQFLKQSTKTLTNTTPKVIDNDTEDVQSQKETRTRWQTSVTNTKAKTAVKDT